MRTLLRTKKRQTVLAGAFMFALSNLFGQAVTTVTFVHTGAVQNYTIPSLCVNQVTIEVWGAEGGGSALSSNSSSGLGGKGGYARGTLTVTPGSVMYVYVGGYGLSSTSGVAAGGFNGGGSGYASSSGEPGNGGGGATDIRVGGTAFSNRVIIAGGGGGGGEDSGDSYGHGGGTTGVGYSGYDATQTAAGPGGFLGIGATTGSGDGGGGGGGLYGGGTYSSTSIGTDTQGGGGGSGYVGGVTSTSLIAGNATMPNPSGGTMTGRSGHGYVRISYIGGNAIAVSASPSVICNGGSATLTASGVTSYTWDSGSTATSIVVSPTSNTTYTVAGTDAAGCTSSLTVNVPVNLTVPNLTVVNTASASSGICPSKTVALTASGAITHVWSGGISNGVAFAPTSSQVYTVTGTNACGTSTAASSISIHPLPTVGASASTPSLCSGLSLTLTATGNAATYTWNAGVTNGVGFFPSTTNTYIVIGTSALSCTATASTIVTVVTTPSLTPSVNPVSICIGNASTLTATGATNYTWLPLGNFAGSNSASVAVSPTAVVNTYTVIKSNANCVDTKTVSVFVNQLPNIFGIATPTLVCAGKPSTLAVGGALTYTWTSPGPPTYTFSGASPVVSPIVTSIYTVVGTDNNGCKNTGTVLVATDPNPTITIAATSTVLCKGQSVTLTASGGLNYIWTSTSGTVTGATITDSPTGPTLYNVTADNSFSCSTTISQIVLVNPTPTVNIAITKTLVCTGGPSTLTATGAHTYSWDANANNALTAGTIVNPIATTIYTVLGTYTTTQCQSTKTIEVKVFTPTITVTSPTNTCYGGNITLVASGANPNSYNWNTGSGFVNPFQTIAVTPTVFTIYTVSAVSGSNGVNCPSTQTTSIGIFYNPTITATPQRTLVCRNESVELYGNGGVSYSWSNAQTGGTITVAPQVNTNYTVTGTDANGCVSTGSIQVKVSGCVGINELNSSATNAVNVYPNPNKGTFNVSSETALTLNLVNELGQSLRTIQLNAANQYKADISDLASGIYFILGEKNGQQISHKIIVTK